MKTHLLKIKNLLITFWDHMKFKEIWILLNHVGLLELKIGC